MLKKLSLGFFLSAALAGCGDSGEGDFSTNVVAGAGGGGGDKAAAVFDENEVTSYHITLDPADWSGMVADPHDNTWRACRVQWKGETYDQVGIRPSGERSRIPGNPKPSLRLSFDQWVVTQEFHGLGSLKLDAMVHDSSMMRARLQYPIYNARGVPAPRYVHCRLYVNGEYKGLYGAEERMTRGFVKRRFGAPVEQLHRWNKKLDLLWSGSDPAIYVPGQWLPRIDDVPSGAEGVRDLTDALNNNLALVPALFDVESFLNFMAVEMITGEGDAYVAGHSGERTANIYLYKSPRTGKYLLLPWDRDQGFWRAETSITNGFSNRILTRNLILWDPAATDRYKQILRELIAGAFEASAIQARVDFIYAQIQDAAFEDPLKPYANSDVTRRKDRIKSYVQSRNEAFRSQLN